jgi:hypothetical protein
MILTNDEEIAKKVNSAIFPASRAGPLMHVIAAKAVAFGEALEPGFKEYARQVVVNAQGLADELQKGGLDIVTGGTDTHLMLVDLRPKGVTGHATEKALGRAAITCNKNGIPFDPEKPTVTSGVRLGSPAATTRGFREAEFRQVGRWIVEVVDGLAANGESNGGSRCAWRPRWARSASGSRSTRTARGRPCPTTRRAPRPAMGRRRAAPRSGASSTASATRPAPGSRPGRPSCRCSCSSRAGPACSAGCSSWRFS